MEVATNFFGFQRKSDCSYGTGYHPHHFLNLPFGTFESPILGLSVKPLKGGMAAHNWQVLKEFYLPFNDVADVSQLKWLNLQVLHFSGY